jgi:8-oxo-dGTP pyrophosphatase MutT (NUDIX family)
MATLQTFRQLLLAALRSPLPGPSAQMTMSVRPRPGGSTPPNGVGWREAAVLILIYERHGELLLPLTRRTQSVEMHRGQISLPGGASEAHDEDFGRTALRETWEELGIAPEHVEIIGQLSPLYIPSSQYCVHPEIGFAEEPPVLLPDPNEVEAIIELPLAVLLDPDTRVEERRWREGQSYLVPAYRWQEHRIWGATAMILAEFVAISRTALAGEPRGMPT